MQRKARNYLNDLEAPIPRGCKSLVAQFKNKKGDVVWKIFIAIIKRLPDGEKKSLAKEIKTMLEDFPAAMKDFKEMEAQFPKMLSPDNFTAPPKFGESELPASGHDYGYKWRPIKQSKISHAVTEPRHTACGRVFNPDTEITTKYTSFRQCKHCLSQVKWKPRSQKGEKGK